ncbi:hypothetical protein DMA12_09205 [Amycolatopsis balhimycina DSM 5908]|uniref:Uncharacterized protein n=1 Tax=Amycolatopsis balhimycina DSM 5908 TaxID=1081091 RepID=A0A428WWE0_AMYBA|nr:streptophobe family protein [Amycolatopsis balhimycina]RSM47389.1 hypothetical protein DMA12_09205 [Amycolatopsis balhimycina DSM 5908]
MREAGRGLAAAAAALLAMVMVAAAGLALLGAGRTGGFGALTAAVVALAAGGTAEVGAAPAGGLPVVVRGDLHLLPLGVSLAGAAVLAGVLLRRRENGLLVRGAAAAAGLAMGLSAFAFAARGKLALPGSVTTAGCVRNGVSPRLPGSGGLDAGFSVAAGPAVAGAVAGTVVVVGTCLLGTRFPVVTSSLRALRWPAAGLAVLCLAAAWIFGGAPAAAVVLLALPQLVCGAVTLGLGVPWTTTGLLSCAPDLSPGGPASWVAAAVLLACGVAARSRRPGDPLRRAVASAVRLGPVVGAVIAVVTLLSRASVDITVSAFGLSLPVFDARLTANPLLALVAGVVGGAVAGFAGSLLADGISVSSRAWKR